MLRLAGYRPGIPFLDPMCGSGTLPIEAAMWAAAVPSGGSRRFGFMRWRCYDETAVASWELEQQRARDFAEPMVSSIRGSDRDVRVLGLARANGARAGVEVDFAVAELRDLDAPLPGTLVVTNPPYGVRMAKTPAQADRWLQDFRYALDILRECTVAIITPDMRLPRSLDLPASREHTLFNGDLECRLFTWLPR
jgi:putative N6-adenine-specific DNA methylase